MNDVGCCLQVHGCHNVFIFLDLALSLTPFVSYHYQARSPCVCRTNARHTATRRDAVATAAPPLCLTHQHVVHMNPLPSA